MGTRFELVLHGDNPRAIRAAGEEAVEAIERWHARLSRFERSSVVSRVASAGGAAVRLDPEAFAALAWCEAVRAVSAGAFDATLGSGVLTLDAAASTARLTGDAPRLDLGGVGKGIALDDAAEILRGHGVSSALLHGGTSTIAAIGARPDGSPWRVIVEGVGGQDPRGFDLVDGSLSVSSDAVQGAHLVDPRTGRAVTRRTVAVCTGPSAAATDAWSTALYVDGTVPGEAGVGAFLWEGGAWRHAVKGQR